MQILEEAEGDLQTLYVKIYSQDLIDKAPQCPLNKSPRSGVSIGVDFKSSCKSVREHTIDMPDQRDQEIGSFKLVVHKMQDNLF